MKKFLLVLCTLAFALSMTACTKQEEEVTPVMEASSLESSVSTLIDSLSQLSDEELESYTSSRDKMSRTMAEAWLSAEEEAGEFVSAPETYEITNYEDYSSVTGTMQFADRDATLTVEIGYEDDDATEMGYLAFRINPIYSKGELLTQAAQNTLMGMGSVFVILIILVYLIKGLGKVTEVLNNMSNKNNKAAAAVSAPAPVPAAPAVAEEEELVDDLELVAVITAAIAASENTSTDGLVVRSIKRAGASKWKRA